MADANTKVNIFFETFGKKTNCGWTETFYWNTTDLSRATFDLRRGYIPPRVQLLGIGARVKYIRVSSLTTKRTTFVEYLDTSKGTGDTYQTAPEDDFDPAQNDLLLRLQTSVADGSHRRSLWLAGIPDSQTLTSEQSGVTPNFLSDATWSRFVKAIFDLQLRIRWKVADGPPKVYDSAVIAYVTPIETRKRNRGRPFNQFRGKKLV